MSRRRFIFWNVNRRHLTAEACSLVRDADADALVLCENDEQLTPSDVWLETLSARVGSDFHIPVATPGSNARFSCFCRSSRLDLPEVHSGTRVSVRTWDCGPHRSLLVLIHGIDKRNYSPGAQQASLQSIVEEVRGVQTRLGIHRAVWIGDFNVNPYEHVMNSAIGFNAMMTRQCAKRGGRTFLDKSYDFYYNPMWCFFGDSTESPSGTYYHTRTDGTYGWNMLDQVLVHHSLLPFFRNARILTKAGDRDLVDRQGRPTRRIASDHLPILATFDGAAHE